MIPHECESFEDESKWEMYLDNIIFSSVQKLIQS